MPLYKVQQHTISGLALMLALGATNMVLVTNALPLGRSETKVTNSLAGSSLNQGGGVVRNTVVFRSLVNKQCMRCHALMSLVDAAVHKVEITHDQLCKCNLQDDTCCHNSIQTILGPNRYF